MNTGEHLWWIPVGETPDRVRNHEMLEGIDVGETGTGRVAPMTVTSTLLIYQAEASDGTPHLYAVDKATGEQLGKVPIPALSRYGMMSYAHEGQQYIVVQIAGTNHPGSLVALRLP